ncbi:hypothetical protein ANCCEY_05356 [Ancylostoma ceylanicum]|uniref:Uncharacterized protein n=1 Tax=Ancylostoma ceylanicum TaxID=53326 RepID=A0A0D6LUN3_9BILA|nr:hypothetical protein ANCCEY_05356 [Ancylostoma ceylanicum]
MTREYLILSLNIAFVLCGDPPNIYRWMADNSYICGPNRDVDGSTVTFLSEDEGLACTACGTRQKKPPTEACGVRTSGKGNDEEPRIGCFPIPQLCLDDYTLRYANAFPEEIERAKEQAKAEGRFSLSEEKGSEEQSEANSRSHAIDTNRLGKSRGKIEPKEENAVDNEPTVPAENEPTVPVENEPTVPVENEPTVPVENEPTAPVENEPTVPVENEPTGPMDNESTVPLSITTTTTTTANPVVNQELEADQFTPLFTTSTATTKRETEPDFQDITHFETPLTTALTEPTTTFEMTPEPLITTTTELVHPTLLTSEPEILSTEPQITLTTQMHVVTTTSIPTQVDKGESEFLPEELEEDVREILMQKRREGHHFFGTTTVPTTTTTIPTTTTPKVCRDKHKVTPALLAIVYKVTKPLGGRKVFSCAVSGQWPENARQIHSGCEFSAQRPVEHVIVLNSL